MGGASAIGPICSILIAEEVITKNMFRVSRAEAVGNSVRDAANNFNTNEWETVPIDDCEFSRVVLDFVPKEYEARVGFGDLLSTEQDPE